MHINTQHKIKKDDLNHINTTLHVMHLFTFPSQVYTG